MMDGCSVYIELVYGYIFQQSPWADWQKFDYLIEFGQWLYCNEFPLQDAMDQIEWAIDILLNMKYEQEKSRRSTGMWRSRGQV